MGSRNGKDGGVEHREGLADVEQNDVQCLALKYGEHNCRFRVAASWSEVGPGGWRCLA